MISNLLKRKEVVYCLSLSYVLLVVGTIPLVVPINPSLATPMMAGNLAYTVMLCSVFIGVTWIYMKKSISAQGVAPSIIVFIISMFIVLGSSTAAYEFGKIVLGLNKSEIVGYQRLIHIVIYRLSHDLVTLALSFILAFALTAPLRIYRKFRIKD